MNIHIYIYRCKKEKVSSEGEVKEHTVVYSTGPFRQG